MTGSAREPDVDVPFYYSQLANLASDLNAVSDQLAIVITDFESLLKKLDLGVEVWVRMKLYGSPSDPSWYSTEELGYAKIGEKWAIGLRTTQGDEKYPDSKKVETWAFTDAPRALRIESVTFLPKLLEELHRKATDTVTALRKTLSSAQEFLDRLKIATEEIAPPKMLESPLPPYDNPATPVDIRDRWGQPNGNRLAGPVPKTGTGRKA